MKMMTEKRDTRKDRGSAASGCADQAMGLREVRGGSRNSAVLGISLLCGMALAACGGGGGGDGPNSINVGGQRTISFATSFSQLAGSGSGGSLGGNGDGNAFSGTVEMSGETISGNLTRRNGPLQFLTYPASGQATVSIQMRNGALLSFDLLGQGTEASFQTRKVKGRHEIQGDDVAGNFLDPIENKFEYQTFGSWMTRVDQTGSWGAASFGRRTAASNLPSGSATYKANGSGLLIESGTTYATTSDIEITTTDYASVDIASTNSMKAPLTIGGADSTPVRDPYLDFVGVGGIVTGSDFEINIGDRRRRNGEVRGWFYGPEAEEIGGTYNLGSAYSHHLGAFGGKKN